MSKLFRGICKPRLHVERWSVAFPFWRWATTSKFFLFLNRRGINSITRFMDQITNTFPVLVMFWSFDLVSELATKEPRPSLRSFLQIGTSCDPHMCSSCNWHYWLAMWSTSKLSNLFGCVRNQYGFVFNVFDLDFSKTITWNVLVVTTLLNKSVSLHFFLNFWSGGLFFNAPS